MRIVNEDTRDPVDPPVRHALITGDITLLADRTVLVGENGEIPIEDSGAASSGMRGSSPQTRQPPE
jgi:hypothetical protein